MGKTYADLYRVLGKEENINVALDVRSTDFIQIFIERINRLSLELNEWKNECFDAKFCRYNIIFLQQKCLVLCKEMSPKIDLYRRIHRAHTTQTAKFYLAAFATRSTLSLWLMA